jgi:N-methylhydantoinase A
MNSSEGSTSSCIIGVDVGGTHTDLCVSDGVELHRAKALTTHHDYSEGILDALGVAAENLGTTTEQLLGRTSTIVNGTTIVTNAITELRGAKVGVFVTQGFPDTFRLIGGARRNVYDDHQQLDPPAIITSDLLVEVPERIGPDGVVLVDIDEQAVRDGVRRLREAGAETLAVCLLWSFKSPEHEQRVKEIAEEVWPGVFITLSSDIHPVIREYERFMTAVFNSFCQPAAVRLLDTLDERLIANGFRGTSTFFSGGGGAVSAELAKRFPVMLLASGPAGGVIGATHVAELLGEPNVIVGDMGGTSFDTSLVQNGLPSIVTSVKIDEFDTGISLIDVISVGAGGGSIAWIDQRGVPQVGPVSAGSMPGPACYGRGGTQPTVTDAAVVLGLIDPNGYLGGRFSLDADASRSALDGVFGDRFGWTAAMAAEGVAELTSTNMAHALRRVSVERGHDPREFLMLAYGGTLPMFVTRICEKLGMSKVIVPYNSSVFSAFGVSTADYVRRYSRTVEWSLERPEGVERVNVYRSDMLSRAREEALIDGFDDDSVSYSFTGEFRFEGQVYEVSIPLPNRPLDEDDALTLADVFPEHYEQTYGKGTAWREVPVVLLTLGLTATAARPKPTLRRWPVGTSDAASAITGERNVYDARSERYESIPVLAEHLFEPGMVAAGPLIVDQRDTTIFVSPGWTARRDEYRNFVLATSNPTNRPAPTEEQS